jgi:uncharacterized protein (TIGR02679 family)
MGPGDGTCRSGGLCHLATSDLAWLWTQLADVADRRGDADLTVGSAMVTPPDKVAGRAAAAGLLGRRHLAAGQRTRINLAALAQRIAPLTPGAVAAHVTGRRLAQRQERAGEQARSEAALRGRLAVVLPAAATDGAWADLRRSGWVSRLRGAGGIGLVDKAAKVIGLLPRAGAPAVDRRVLAQAVAHPHALDSGTLPGLVLALLLVTGRLPAGTSARDAWTALGVRQDDIVGGLTMVGIVPAGWVIPGLLPVTLPPRVVSTCEWPSGGTPVFVTENPSVLSAGIDLGAPIICTSGTPPSTELAAISRLEDSGWQLHVRADFDAAGLNHVRSVLAVAPGAIARRMSADDYLDGLARSDESVPLRLDRLGKTPWDPELVQVMTDCGVAVFEEVLLDDLLEDMAAWPG